MSQCSEEIQSSGFKKDPPFSIAIHGGAGVISKDFDGTKHLEGLEAALRAGYNVLEKGGSALDAVEAAVISLEDNELFNAGRGSVFTSEGTHELEASIIDGTTMKCGAVTGVCTVKNPVILARKVMEHTPYVFLGYEGAEKFAREQNVELVEPSYFSTPHRLEQLRSLQDALHQGIEHAMGTVGAVALDKYGQLAAATSTGGRTNKRPGRIGDTPIIGAGCYATSLCAVSGTGNGEEFIRHSIGSTITTLVRAGKPLKEAVNIAVHELLQPGDGGVIAVDKAGNLVTEFNSEGMFRGRATSEGEFSCSIWE